MGFPDFPFVTSADPRRLPDHEEVLPCPYLEAFAVRFDLHQLVRFETEVVRVRREPGGGWSVASRKLGEEEQVYDAIVVCTGHYTEPRVATIPCKFLRVVV
jgi:aliphatic glucosinolate S-oxygenase